MTIDLCPTRVDFIRCSFLILEKALVGILSSVFSLSKRLRSSSRLLEKTAFEPQLCFPRAHMVIQDPINHPSVVSTKGANN